jgi:hypothetical protein
MTAVSDGGVCVGLDIGCGTRAVDDMRGDVGVNLQVNLHVVDRLAFAALDNDWIICAELAEVTLSGYAEYPGEQLIEALECGA